MLVPSKTANCDPPVNSDSVDERIWPPGAATSGLSRWPNAVGPAEEKLVITPLRFVTMSCTLPLTRTAIRPVEPIAARSAAPSMSAIIADGTVS